MITNILVGALNCTQYAEYLSAALNRSASNVYLCKNLFTSAYALFRGGQKSDLNDQNYTPLSFREITLYGMALKPELQNNPRDAERVAISLRTLNDNRSTALLQQPVIMRIIRISIDCLLNLFGGLGLVTSTSLSEQLCHDLTQGRAPDALEPSVNQPLLPGTSPTTTGSRASPPRAQSERREPSATPQRDELTRTTSASLPSRSSSRRLDTPPLLLRTPSGRHMSVRERTELINRGIRDSYLPPDSPSPTGAPSSEHPRSEARQRYMDGSPSAHDLFLIFQCIESMELNEVHPFNSMEGLLTRLSESDAVDLNLPISQRIVADGFQHLTKETCDHLVNWLKNRLPPEPLVQRCLHAFITRSNDGHPISIYAVQELLFLYARMNPEGRLNPIARRAFEIINSIDPNHHRMDQLSSIYRS
jgi:hypothetical protein